MESLYFLVPLFFIIIFITPLSFRIKVNLNLLKKYALTGMFLWKIKVINFKIFIRDNSIFILTKKKKKEIEISLSLKQIYFVEQLLENLKDKIQLKKTYLSSKIGTFDAYQTAIICGTVDSLVKTFFCFIKNKKPTCSMENYINPCFSKEIFLMCCYVNFNITLFDLLYSLIISLFSLKRRSYERRKQSKLS